MDAVGEDTTIAASGMFQGRCRAYIFILLLAIIELVAKCYNVASQPVDENHSTKKNAPALLIRERKNETINMVANIPNCARHLVFPLDRVNHTAEGIGDDSDGCWGVLVFDGVVLTSRRCSRHPRQIDNPFINGYDGENGDERVLHLEAAKEGGSFYLADNDFSKHQAFMVTASPPTPHLLASTEVSGPRARVIFSQDHPLDRRNSETILASTITCMDTFGRAPVLSAFPLILGDNGHTHNISYLSLAQIREHLPSGIIWADEVDTGAIAILQDSTNKLDRWYSRKVTHHSANELLHRAANTIVGPPGSVYIPTAIDHLTPVGLTLEVIDPRGHRDADCMKKFHKWWKLEDPFSGMHYFDWLDYRRPVERPKSMKVKGKQHGPCIDMEKFDTSNVHYFSDDERREHDVRFSLEVDRNNSSMSVLFAHYKSSGEPVPSNQIEKPHLFMWGLDSNVYVVVDEDDDIGRIKHSSILAGGAGLGAGTLFIGDDGKVEGISIHSGHYKPTVSTAARFHLWLKKQLSSNSTDYISVTSSTYWVGRKQWGYGKEICDSCKWSNEGHALGYGEEELMESCEEVRSSSTWIAADDLVNLQNARAVVH